MILGPSRQLLPMQTPFGRVQDDSAFRIMIKTSCLELVKPICFCPLPSFLVGSTGHPENFWECSSFTADFLIL